MGGKQPGNWSIYEPKRENETVQCSLTISRLFAFGRLFPNPRETESPLCERRAQYLLQKDYVSAGLEFLDAIRIDSKDAELYYQLGLAELGKGAQREAVRAFLAAADLEPGRAKYKLKLAELLAARKNLDDVQKAKGLAQSAASMLPGNADALSALAIAEWRLGNEQDAETHLREAIAAAPNDLKSFPRLAGVNLSKGDFRGAEDVLRQMVQHSPDSAEGAVALGRFYLMRARIDDAEKEFRRAVETHPTYGPALADLAAVQFLNRRNDLAEQSYQSCPHCLGPNTGRFTRHFWSASAGGLRLLTNGKPS
jgi:tetratricopeptide (TPR) repeat protein